MCLLISEPGWICQAQVKLVMESAEIDPANVNKRDRAVGNIGLSHTVAIRGAVARRRRRENSPNTVAVSVAGEIVLY